MDRFNTGIMSYDGAGNVYQIGGDRYVYDQASRLKMGTVVQAPGSNRKEEFTYDAFDNIQTLRRDGSFFQSYNIQTSTNRLLGNNDIVYNTAGHMLEVGPYSGGHPRYEMEYDPYGMQTRFVSRETATPVEHLYLYGPGDRRLVVYNTATGEREFKLRGLGDEVLREYSVTGWGEASGGQGGEGWVHVKDFLYGPEGIFATRTRAGNATYLHKDHLGTPRLLTDDQGDTVGRHDYYPFGTEIPRGGQADEPTKKYTGHERDLNGRADYMLGRTYLYPFMRFATPDPARDGWSLYAYTGNNPVNYVDPDGHYGVVATGLEITDMIAEGISLLLSVAPGFGEVKDAGEAIFGVDPVTGEELTGGERLLTGVATLLPVVGGKLVREVGGVALGGADEAAGIAASTSVGRRSRIGSSGPDAPSERGLQTPQHSNPAFQPVQSGPGQVGGREYSGHAFDQMRNRGLVPSVVENTIQNGRRAPGNTPQTAVYVDTSNSTRVVVNDTGRVVTVE